MCECVNVIVGLIGMVERGESWNRKGSPRGRRRIAEGPPTFELKNQQLAILYDSCTQCTGFQEICNCHKEGTKNPQIREKECVNELM